MVKLKDIMITRVVSIDMDDRLSIAKEIFDHVEFHHLPVTENDVLVGVLTKKDMQRVISPYIGQLAELPRDAKTLEQRVHQVMTRDPVCLSEDFELLEAAEIMLDNGISCLPVVDYKFIVVGMITWRDLLRACLLHMRNQG